MCIFNDLLKEKMLMENLEENLIAIVIDINSNVILSIQREYGLQGLNIFPLQYWRPSKGKPVTLEKKLSLLKTN